MKLKLLLLGIVIALVGCATASNAIDDLNMGLSKTSVFDVPTPGASNYSTIKPGKSDRLEKSYHTAPPQITHTVDEYMPITLEENECLDCHDRRKLLDKTWVIGKKLPMSDSHYGTFFKAGGVEDVAGARYNCTQCHAQQSDAKPLVSNSFK